MQEKECNEFLENILSRVNIIEGEENIKNEIIRLHKENNLALDKEFERNNLLFMDSDSRFSLSYQNYHIIFEKFPYKNFRINVPVGLLLHIKELFEKKFIVNIAFKIECISDCTPSMEGKEVGSELTFKLDTIPNITRFYSDYMYKEQFWVFHNAKKKSIVFEEINDDKLDDNCFVITNVIHLMYFEENGDFYISHIDHERIYYTIGEFDEKFKTKNFSIKGRKEKTFKIDNSRIPIDFMHNNEYFIYRVLDSYILNKDILEEYFTKLKG